MIQKSTKPVFVIFFSIILYAVQAQPDLGIYNVIWESPSADATGQMPLGNGDIAAGVYAIENDALYILLSKNDAFTYKGNIFKIGRIRIALDPNPLSGDKPFKQILDLKTGSVLTVADGIEIRVWADANNPVYHVQINPQKVIKVSADADLWKRIDNASYNRTSEPRDYPTQDIVLKQNGQIQWYYAVGDRSVYPTELKYYEAEHMASQYPDPYRFNTFGNLMESPELALKDNVLSGKGMSFDIRIHAMCQQEPDINKWIQVLRDQASRPWDISRDWQLHCDWWKEFWKRSWITVTDNTVNPGQRKRLDHEAYKSTRTCADEGVLVAQSYNVFRYLMACQSRGRIQTKFNGGLFTQPQP
jgi:hypothetical protein